MAAEYSFIPVQTVAEGGNILFESGERACHKGCILHRAGAGQFKLKGAQNACKTIYRVTFTGNIAIAAGGTLGEISVGIQEDGETLGNAIASVVPAAIGDFFHVALSTFIVIPCGCCATVGIENTSDGTPIDVTNANIIFDRVA